MTACLFVSGDRLNANRGVAFMFCAHNLDVVSNDAIVVKSLGPRIT